MSLWYQIFNDFIIKMQKLYITIGLLFWICVSQIQSLHVHTYYALENTNVVSQSQSIKQMNKCKEDCLVMNKHFPFKFKFHRYILREKIGNNKYFEGTCHFTLKDSDYTWYDWADLKIYITDTTLKVNMSQVQRWQQFRDKCEDTALKLEPGTLQNMGFSKVHSNFQYYDNGTFVNLEPFTDINSMLDQVVGLIK